MELRPVWRGHLRLALVSCAVSLFSTKHERSNLHFNLINPATGHRVRSIMRDAETEDEVSRSELVKGYEFKKDHYVLMDDEDFAQARTESSSVMKIEKFVKQDSIDPIYFDSSYFLAPDGDSGEDVYAVLHEAISRTGMAALTRCVMMQRERVVAVRVAGKGLVAHTLHEARDLNDAAKIFANLPTGKPDGDMIKLAEQLIERQTGQYDATDFEDRYEQRLRAVIEAKLKGEGIEPEAEEAPRDNVIDLMSALRQSLGGAEPGSGKSGGGKKPAPPAKSAKAAPKRASSAKGRK